MLFCHKSISGQRRNDYQDQSTNGRAQDNNRNHSEQEPDGSNFLGPFFPRYRHWFDNFISHCEYQEVCGTRCWSRGFRTFFRLPRPYP